MQRQVDDISVRLHHHCGIMCVRGRFSFLALRVARRAPALLFYRLLSFQETQPRARGHAHCGKSQSTAAFLLQPPYTPLARGDVSRGRPRRYVLSIYHYYLKIYILHQLSLGCTAHNIVNTPYVLKHIILVSTYRTPGSLKARVYSFN